MEEETGINSENEFSNDVVTSNFDSSAAEFAKTTEQPLTDEEMRNCKYCSYQAPDWPVRILFIFITCFIFSQLLFQLSTLFITVIFRLTR